MRRKRLWPLAALPLLLAAVYFAYLASEHLWESSPEATRARDAADTRRPELARTLLDKPARPRSPPERTATSTRAQPTSSSDCQPYVGKGCYAGNVHWLDGCDNVQDLDQDCGDGFCHAGQCIAEDWSAACTEPVQGRCDGDQVVYCDLGRTAVIDCGASNKACRLSTEGAVCVELDPATACSPGPARCDGDVLESCVAGVRQTIDCRQVGGSCAKLPEYGAACTEPLRQAANPEADCGACGCAVEPTEETESCNGEDDDLNGFVDDGIFCGPVTLNVLVGTGDYNEQLVDAESLRAEIELTNRLFRDSGSQLRFRLGAIDDLMLPNANKVSFEDLVPLLDSLEGPGDVAKGEFAAGENLETETSSSTSAEPEHAGGTPYPVRLVIVKELTDGDVPKLGVAFPFVTHGCGRVLRPGGQRFDRALVAVAQRRTSTTLAHELGHLLGLCHTHEQEEPSIVPVAVTADEQTETCGTQCSSGGDAICDTPVDDESCVYDPETCLAQCPNQQRPDTSNIMSYYHACRARFTQDQVRLMDHTLALRRLWFHCRDGACECHPSDSPCPTGMSCRPTGGEPASFRCGMDGPSVPGASCSHNRDCSDNSLCFKTPEGSVCARTCSHSSSDCTCLPTGTASISLCQQDVAP